MSGRKWVRIPQLCKFVCTTEKLLSRPVLKLVFHAFNDELNRLTSAEVIDVELVSQTHGRRQLALMPEPNGLDFSAVNFERKFQMLIFQDSLRKYFELIGKERFRKA